jgi:hypothetical protein
VFVLYAEKNARRPTKRMWRDNNGMLQDIVRPVSNDFIIHKAGMLTSRRYSISINLQKFSSLDVGGNGGTGTGTLSHVSDSPHATLPLYT